MVPRIRCSTPEPEEGRARSFFRGSRPDGARSGPCVRQAGPRCRWEWPGRGPLPPGEEPPGGRRRRPVAAGPRSPHRRPGRRWWPGDHGPRRSTRPRRLRWTGWAAPG